MAAPLNLGSEMPMIGYGTFIGIEEKPIEDHEKRAKATEEAVFKALKCGYRHLDCASNYGNLVPIGKALERAMAPKEEGGLAIPRGELWITSKGSPNEDMESTLAQLKLTSLDLFLWHHPNDFDSEEHCKEAWQKICDFSKEGQARHVGVSNCYISHLEHLIKICEKHNLSKPFADEVEIHLKCQEDELLSFCRDRDIRLIAYSPLGYANRQIILDDPIVTESASVATATPAQVSLAWNINRDVCVIPKSLNSERMAENLSSLEIVARLGEEQMKSLHSLDWQMPLTATAEHFKASSSKIEW